MRFIRDLPQVHRSELPDYIDKLNILRHVHGGEQVTADVIGMTRHRISILIRGEALAVSDAELISKACLGLCIDRFDVNQFNPLLLVAWNKSGLRGLAA